MKNIHEIFPLSNEEGSPTDTINSELMNDMCKNGELVKPSNFDEILKGHKDYLKEAGINGKWQTLLAAGLTLAIYIGNGSQKYHQACFRNMNLTLLTLSNTDLICVDFTNVFYEGGTFKNSIVKNSMFIDSILSKVDFSYADLSKCDFSRSIMTNCNFTGANLSGCDFENCDLTGSTFTNAILTGSRFPGAKLENVIY